jgi:serine/threonine-protein kinase
MTQQIGQYRILSELGAGGMGIVYRALDTELGREVALKRLRSEFAASTEVLERFRNEAKLQGRLNHPGIAQLYSLVQTQEAFCIVMEMVEGVIVKELMPLDWQLAVTVIWQVLEALGYAHGMGVLHRDIKPENILIDRRGTVKVMDFGIAYAVGSQRMTREKSILGTIEYMPPERILSQPMDARSDVYSLGILLFELLSGKLPFDLTNEYEILRWQLEGRAPGVSAVSAAPDGFDRIIEKAMSKDPAQRYASCAEMASDLHAVVGTMSVSANTLRDLVAGRIAQSKAATFNNAQCYTRVAEQIRAGELNAAERSLQAEANRFPQESGLRQYLAVVARARMEAERAAPANRDQILSWLRLIAADRCGDRKGYAAELSRASSTLPAFTIAHLLNTAARQREGASQ